jgi:hypothetical protein
VVTASRSFICIRPATYESVEEGKLLQSIFPGRGQLENTVFALFEPDGQTMLSKSGRSPGMVFGSKAKFLAELQMIAARFSGKPESSRALPCVPDLRLALNEAACDSAPLAIAYATSEKELAQVESALAKFAWDPRFVGRLNYAAILASESKPFAARGLGQLKGNGIIIVQPNEFGTELKQLATCNRTSDSAQLARVIEQALAAHAPSAKEAQSHIRIGRREGIEWESAIPVTDPDENRRGAANRRHQKQKRSER